MEWRSRFFTHERIRTPKDAPVPLCGFTSPHATPPRKRRSFWKRLGRGLTGFTLHTLAIPVYLGMGLFYGGFLSLWVLDDTLRKKQFFDALMIFGIVPLAAIFGVFFCLVIPFKTFSDCMEDEEDVPIWKMWPFNE